MLGTIIGALILGTILGILGRLVVPGKQDLPWWLTILVGILSALVGGYLYEMFGGGETGGIDWLKFLVQLITAAVFVSLVAALWSKKKQRTS